MSTPKGLPVGRLWHTFAGGGIYPIVNVQSPNRYALVDRLPVDDATNGKLLPILRRTCDRSPICHTSQLIFAMSDNPTSKGAT
jgi:hypothetical protein